MSSSKEGTVTRCISSIRHCVGKCVGTAPPDLMPEVEDLLVSLRMTPRQVHELFHTFKELKQYDPLTMTTGPDEASTASMVRLVRTKRTWVEKIMLLLLDLAGFTDVVTWDGFVFVFIQFCTLSKLELCQVMFFIISKEMKSWTVRYLTSTQLEEFYDDYHECPIRSFNTSGIDFSKLALAKYRMNDFIELLFRFSQLINPCMHLQRSLQQAMPDLRFWSDYDRVKLNNRKITLDFFRIKKIMSIFDLVRVQKAAEGEHDPHEAELKQLMEEINKIQGGKKASSMYNVYGEPLTVNEMTAKGPVEVTHVPELHGMVPMPLGIQPPPRKSRWLDYPKKLPDWMEEQLKENQHPIWGNPLGTAAALKRAAGPFGDHDPGTWAILAAYWEEPPAPGDKVVVDRGRGTVQNAKAAIQETFGHDPSKQQGGPTSLLADRERKPQKEQMKLVLRSQELEFIRKNRRGEPKRDNMVDILSRATPCELIDRPVKKVQGHV